MIKTQLKKHYENLTIFTYNFIFAFIISNRNYGKTWSFKKRQFRRGVKNGKKTLWIRRFKKEVKECINTFYKSSDLLKFCGIIPYDSKTKQGNFKQEGNVFYCLHNGKWIWFLKIIALSDSNAMRSADDVDCDLMVFDEFTTTPEKYRRYRGNEVEDFIDAFFSAKREHKMQAVFLGNKESFNNPFFTYFEIKPPEENFDGIRKYKKGAIIVQQINNIASKDSEYDSKVYEMLKNTNYGKYIYNNKTKTAKGLKCNKIPADSILYCQINSNNNEIKITFKDGYFYVGNTIDKTRIVYCDKFVIGYSNCCQLQNRHKKFFEDFTNAVTDGKVKYESEKAFESIQYFYKWLGILN